jgi:hypothetical protein
VCVCVCVCMHTYIHVCERERERERYRGQREDTLLALDWGLISVYVCLMSIYVCLFLRTHTHMPNYVYAYIHTCMYIHVHKHTGGRIASEVFVCAKHSCTGGEGVCMYLGYGWKDCWKGFRYVYVSKET